MKKLSASEAALLDALKTLVEAATHHQSDARAAINQARAAIEKARVYNEN